MQHAKLCYAVNARSDAFLIALSCGSGGHNWMVALTSTARRMSTCAPPVSEHLNCPGCLRFEDADCRSSDPVQSVREEASADQVATGMESAEQVPELELALTEVTSHEASDQKEGKWKVVLLQKADWDAKDRVQKAAKQVMVGAGARVLFYPTLLYNVVRNKLQPEFRWWDQVDQGLLLGAVPFPGDVMRLKTLGVKGVVTLNEPYETLVPSSMYLEHGIEHLVIPTRDYLFAPSFTDIRRAVDFIHEHFRRGETTYVHCKAGRGRSTTVVLCYLVEYRGMSPLDALHYVRARRPRVMLAAAQWKAVQAYSKHMYSTHGACTYLPHLLPLPPSSSESEETSDLNDAPVLVSKSDLVGYSGIEDAGVVGNELWNEFGTIYRVRFMAARSIVQAVGVARTSVAWARLSDLWLGCQAEEGVLNTGITMSHLSASEVIRGMPPFGGQLSVPRIEVPVCQSSMVNG